VHFVLSFCLNSSILSVWPVNRWFLTIIIELWASNTSDRTSIFCVLSPFLLLFVCIFSFILWFLLRFYIFTTVLTQYRSRWNAGYIYLLTKIADFRFVLVCFTSRYFYTLSPFDVFLYFAIFPADSFIMVNYIPTWRSESFVKSSFSVKMHREFETFNKID